MRRSDFYLNRYTDFTVIYKISEKNKGLGLYDFISLTCEDYFNENEKLRFTNKRDCEKLRSKLHLMSYEGKIMKTEVKVGEFKKVTYIQQKR